MGLVEEGGEGGDFEGGGGGGGGGDEDDFFSYDVFLSHRQGDAQDFCRHLYEILTEKYGLRVFLDRASESLEFHDLPTLVRRSRCFVFVLSSGIFDSVWCLRELKAAVEAAALPAAAHPVALLPLRLEGATWGERRSTFPDLDGPYVPRRVPLRDHKDDDHQGDAKDDAGTAGTAAAAAAAGGGGGGGGGGDDFFDPRPALRELFKVKCVEHSREYFDVFIERLVSRLPQSGEGGGGGGGGGGSGGGGSGDRARRESSRKSRVPSFARASSRDGDF